MINYKIPALMAPSLFFKSALIFIFFFSLFLSGHLLNGHFISSDDPYYHAKHALLIEQSGQLNLVRPWLEFHFFNYAPTDPWWGFHLGQAFFIHWFGLFLGVEVFASLLAALVFLVFYLVLHKLSIKYPLLWTLLLFSSSVIFDYRLFLERPHLLSIIVMPLAFLLLAKGKNLWLFILSLLYTLCYQLAPLIILLAIIYSAVQIYIDRRLNFRPLIAAAGGVLAGIAIHPAGLNYLYVIFVHFFQVIFLKFYGIDLNIGSELRMTDISYFIKYNFLAILFYITAIAIFLANKKNPSSADYQEKSASQANSRGEGSVISNFLFLYSSLWFLVTLLVPRGVEYWLPAIFLFAAHEFSVSVRAGNFKIIKNFLADKINLKIVGLFLVSAFSLVVINNLNGLFCDIYYYKTDEISENYRQASVWLKANSAAGAVVYYNNWGMWPLLFFHNDYNHYIVGMDPTLMYEYGKNIYWLWHNLSYRGLYCDQPTPCLGLSPREQLELAPLAIREVFRAKYAVVANDEFSDLIKTLNNLGVKLVFKNKDLLIYEIK